MIISRSFQIFSRATALARALMITLLVGITGMVQALDTQVNIFAVYAAAEEEGGTPGQFLIQRNDATTPVTVNFSVSGTAFFSDDYTTTDFTGTPGLSTATGSISFAVGVVSATITIVPVDDLELEGSEVVLIALTPSAFSSYQLGSYSSAQVVIADDDEVATISRPDNVADEDTINASVNLDGDYGRRAVYRVTWEPAAGVAPFPIKRTIRVRFHNPTPAQVGIAQLGTDYEVHHKIIGSNSSYIGCVSTPTETTGLGYKVYGHLRGETVIQVAGGSGPIPTNAQVRFGESLATYNLSASSTGNGIGTITLSTPLTQNVANNASVTVLLTSGTAPTGYAINVPYPVSETEIKVGDGNGLYVGDVFRISGNESNHYVVTQSTAVNAFGGRQIHFRRYLFDGESLGGGSGLGDEIKGVVAIDTFFLTPLSGNVAAVDIPVPSDRIEFSITPKRNDASGPEGAETVTMTMDKSVNYAIKDPTSSTVIIADADVSVSVSQTTSAQRPSTSGKFLVTLTGGPFPEGKNVDVRYVVSGTATSGVDYVPLDGLLVIPGGASSGEIEVKPKDLGTAGTQTVTVTLLNSYDYVLSGSAGAGTNASATLNISDSAGRVSIAASTNDAIEGTIPTSSFFTITLQRTAAGPINVNYSISGSAAASRYHALGPIVISGTTATLTVTPRDNNIADGTQGVIVTLLPGDGYLLSSSLPVTATVRIRDDEPSADGANADKPTPGTINSGSSSGGCGLGSGLATLLGFGLFALLAFRRRTT
ncbi:MAG: hypothetical protein H0W78_07990 [Planctomycetes bacterium]|nr:hypothetical protein [Planctomycetota bacterium]